MLSLLGFGAYEFFGITLDYLLASALIAGGLYLAAFFNLSAANPLAWLLRPLRGVGYALVGAGIALGAFSYGKSVTAADCIAAGRLAAVQQENASLRRDLAAQKAAIQAKEEEAAKLAAQQRDADDQIASWQSYAASLSTTAASCRRATADDDARLCKLLGNAPAGCRAAR